MNELKEGIDALAERRKMPKSAHILPDEENSYIAVWQTDTDLFIRILQTEVPIDLKLDKNIIPHLVDALIDLQND